LCQLCLEHFHSPSLLVVVLFLVVSFEDCHG